ncbi:MAG: (2Fe-2S)-binding protein [Planctomycetota bacterium]
MNDPNESVGGVSRRSFLKGTSAVAAATLATTTAQEQAALAREGGSAAGPGAVPVTLLVNGKELKTELEPRVTLLDALRDYLDVTGCKRVCDRGTCGACTVLLDGKPIYSCSTLAIEAQGAKITTDEGLMKGDELHPVQQAFWNRDASQCGFCTPGFVVACTAVLQKNPKASVEEIKRGLDGNICRCGTYEQMAQALEDLVGGKS